MKRSLQLSHAPIDESALQRDRAASSTAGAALTFLGIVRGLEGNAGIAAIDYESFEPMARHQFDLLFDELARRWPVVESVRVVHRLGPVPVAEPSLWLEVLSPHRGEAFAAGQWLIDEMKRIVPIWKRPVPAL